MGGPWPVSIEHVEGLGLCLIATRDIEANEAFLRESPLLITDVQTPGTKAACSLQAFCGASEAVRASVLAKFWSPMDMVSDMHRDCQKQVAQVAGATWAQDFDPLILQKALLAFRLNAHSFSGGRLALFPVGSKIEHSCSPNSIFSDKIDQKLGCHVATRRIVAGERISDNCALSSITPVFRL